MPRAPDSDTARLTAMELVPSPRRRDPEARSPVLKRVNDLRRFSRRCSLYSVGPSCGSASRRVTVVLSMIGSSMPDRDCCSSLSPSLEGIGLAACWRAGVFVPVPAGGVAHGDDTRGGSGSKVNMEAMSGSFSRFAVYAEMGSSFVVLDILFMYCRLICHVKPVSTLSWYVSSASGRVAIIMEAS